MNAPALRPTTTQRVRTFLADHGAPLRPWCGLDETYGQLYALLRKRRDDPEFWEPLARLLEEVIDDAVDPHRTTRLPAPQAELLSSWDVDELVRNLKEALPADEPLESDDGAPPPDLRGLSPFTGRLSAAMLGGFLLLGFVAAGCTTSDPDETGAGGAGGAGGGEPTPAWAQYCSLDSSSTLWTAIDESSLSDAQKADLCQCFFTMNADWKDGLTELFETGTPQQVATTLESMITCCNYGGGTSQGFPEGADVITTDFCEPQPLYKGVSFPR